MNIISHKILSASASFCLSKYFNCRRQIFGFVSGNEDVPGSPFSISTACKARPHSGWGRGWNWGKFWRKIGWSQVDQLLDSRTEGGSPGSSLVDGKRARRRPVAPSYRALEAGAQERALEKELRLDFPKKLLKTTTSFCYLYLVSPISFSFQQFLFSLTTVCMLNYINLGKDGGKVENQIDFNT